MHRENPRSSHKSQFPSSSIMRHRRRLGTTPTRLSHRLGLSDEGRATAFPTRSGALVANVHLGADRAAVTLSRTPTAAASRRDGRPPEADLKRPGTTLSRYTACRATSLDWGQPRVSPRRSHDEFGLGQATRCHHGARTPTQTNIFLHGVRRARPLLSARRRVPALPVSVRAAIPARRAHHPDHLEEEPAAGPSLTRRRARGKLLSSTQ